MCVWTHATCSALSMTVMSWSRVFDMCTLVATYIARVCTVMRSIIYEMLPSLVWQRSPRTSRLHVVSTHTHVFIVRTRYIHAHAVSPLCTTQALMFYIVSMRLRLSFSVTPSCCSAPLRIMRHSWCFHTLSVSWLIHCMHIFRVVCEHRIRCLHVHILFHHVHAWISIFSVHRCMLSDINTIFLRAYLFEGDVVCDGAASMQCVYHILTLSAHSMPTHHLYSLTRHDVFI
jgi:hypothetical protein